MTAFLRASEGPMSENIENLKSVLKIRICMCNQMVTSEIIP